MRILVVDDDRTVLELVSEVLLLNGYDNVVLASSGNEALEAVDARKDPFDAILLDIQMPDMDGIELCGRIRERAAYRHQPIIMLTAMQEKSYVNAAFAKGANDYITKPFDPLEIGMRLERNLEQFRAVRKPEGISLTACPEVLCEEADCLVAFETFNNYLVQLRRCTAEHAVVAFRVENIYDLEATLSTEAFRKRVHQVARVLNNHLEGDFKLLTFIDQGTFLLVSQGPATRFDDFFRLDLETSANLHATASGSVDIKMSEVARCRKFKEVNSTGVIDQVLRSLDTPTRRTLSKFGIVSRQAI